jgi:hypothetical protein
MKCGICKRRLGPKHAAAGIGPVCAKKNRAAAANAAAGVKITFLSSPRTTRADRRSWLFQRRGEPSYLIRIYPDATGDGRVAKCDCVAGRASRNCEHVKAIADADKRKFYGEGK